MEEFEIDGRKRGFLLGTYTFKLIKQVTGINNIPEVLKKMQDGDEDFKCSFYFCCAKYYALHNKQEVDFEEIDVARWQDVLGYRMIEITDSLFQAYTKNWTAPTMGQAIEQNGQQ